MKNLQFWDMKDLYSLQNLLYSPAQVKHLTMLTNTSSQWTSTWWCTRPVPAGPTAPPPTTPPPISPSFPVSCSRYTCSCMPSYTSVCFSRAYKWVQRVFKIVCTINYEFEESTIDSHVCNLRVQEYNRVCGQQLHLKHPAVPTNSAHCRSAGR